MPTDRQSQPWRETRSPALARLSLLIGAEGEVGQDGWQAAPRGPRLLTDTKSRRSPRFNRKPAGAAAGPRGIAARLAPPRTRLPSCAPLPCAPPSLGAPASPRAPGSPSAPCSARARRRLADSREPPGGEEGGGCEEGGRPPQLRRPGGERRVEEQPWGGTWRPQAEGVLGTRGACGIACPALSFFSFALISPPTARGRGEGCGCGRCARVASGWPRTPRPGAGVGPTDAAATARGLSRPAECLLLSVRTRAGCLGAELFFATFLCGSMEVVSSGRQVLWA
ncbi:translation initiation factor IF-2-like [Pteropus medius]|uniref:translation initiation factor IF-2-like n=1 Tax=Pteropus vampyrus TaxID=132908 RepID=UPI00196B053F|nr:translation initiation factor IF-2-like [Pteropus giganteus]